ncbi:MAG: toll/interleukin-1 receptor domain-containing protein, partial [Blastocatellia bacterium]
ASGFPEQVGMAYEYDIFISYRRTPEALSWITDHFQPLLSHRVGLELDREPEIYVDELVESGTSWPAELAKALGKSRVLIVLWTGNYLASVWCTEELSHMLARERHAKLRTVNKPHGLVIPAFIHDGERFPLDLRDIQHFEIQKCFNVRMARNSPRAEELDEALAREAPAIAACIRNAPNWRKTWPREAALAFFGQFHQQAEALQKTVPRFTKK